MIKTRHIATVIAAAALVLSTAAPAGGFATWPSAKHGGTRTWAYWGPQGVRWGRWYPGQYARSYGYYAPRPYYGCPGCAAAPYHYDDHDDDDDLLWYGLGVATPLLLQQLYHYPTY